MITAMTLTLPDVFYSSEDIYHSGLWRNSPLWDTVSSLSRFQDHLQFDRPHSVRLLYTSDQHEAELST
jgi:hypothetical protein